MWASWADVIAVSMSLRIASLFFSYLRLERVFVLFLVFLDTSVWKIVSVGR